MKAKRQETPAAPRSVRANHANAEIKRSCNRFWSREGLDFSARFDLNDEASRSLPRIERLRGIAAPVIRSETFFPKAIFSGKKHRF
jgi:hypothetical protein